MTQLPVACTLTEPEMARRRAGLFADLKRRRQEARWSPEGVVLRYGPEPDTLALLTEFIQLERRCCPFLHFRLTVGPGDNPAWLELTGPPGTRELLTREIGGPGNEENA
jgi:hypothetical protein